MTLTIYVIENLNTHKKFYGTTKSQNEKFNPLSFFLKQSDNYKLLRESVAKDGFKSHQCRLIKSDMSDDDKQKVVYEKILKLQSDNESLNDLAINPEKVECEDCGFKLRKFFLTDHKEKYCKKTLAQSDLNDLLN